LLGENVRLPTKKELAKFAVEALLGFVLWTVILTPYMILIVETTLTQYIDWLIMEAIIVPPVAVFVVNVTNWIVKKLGLFK